MIRPFDTAEDPDAESTCGSTQALCVRVDRAMHLLDIGKTKLYELIAAGDLETVRIGRRTLIVRQSIDALVERLRSRNRRPG